MWLAWVYQRDKHAPEPLKLIFMSYAAGMAMTAPAALLDAAGTALFPVSGAGLASAAFGAFLVVGPVEEACKFAALRWVVHRHPEFDEPIDGLVYSGAASLGFASLENLIYASQFGSEVIWFRAITAVPAHLLFGGFAGYALGTRFAGRSSSLWGALVLAAAFHGAYDFFVFAAQELGQPGWNLGALLVLVGLAFVHRSQLRTLRRLGFVRLASAGSFCPACRRPLASRGSFCQHCGSDLDRYGEHSICLDCGAAIPAASRFCDRCGAGVSRETRAP